MPKIPKAQIFNEGDKCSTPFGPATVVEHRVAEKIVVVDMVGWKARAYLNEDSAKVMKESILSSLFRRQANSSDSPPKQLDFPYAQGTVIHTPFGVGEVIRPLPMHKKDTPKGDIENSNQTICLGLKSWRLADGSHPKLYCTVKNAQTWKDSKVHDPKKASDGLFSAFGTLVSSTFDFAGRFSHKAKDEEPTLPKVERYYRDSAAVSTVFGNGLVLGFREEDGFYHVSLTGWTLANGVHPSAWLREVDISYQIAKGCQEGYPVLTTFGLTGTLESVQPTTGKKN
jgi:hypothetical protein